MKKFFLMLLVAMISTGAVNAQTDRKAVVKQAKAELTAKATKAARKEAKKFKKEGWQIAPGALPLEKQLDKAYLLQYEMDDSGYPVYVMGEAMTVGQNYDGAKMQALELAKQNMAGQIQTEVTALIENSVANQQLEPEEAATVVKSVLAGKNLISQSIGRTITVTEAFRNLPNKNKEILVRIAYSSELAKKAALNALKKDLGSEVEALQGKLDKLLGM